VISAEQQTKITQALLAYGEEVSNKELFPTLFPEAAPLIATDPYAFLIAMCLDRGSRAEVIWTLPYYMKQELGHLDPKLIYEMSMGDLENLFKRLPKKPHYINAAPRTICELTRIVVEKYNGDASKIWMGKPAREVVLIFESIYGVGDGIANMGVLLIEKAFPVKFDDKSFMDIKSDTHTMRVLYRLGVSVGQDVVSAMEAARRMNPAFPGELDAALWAIGRNWCRPSDPNCPDCPLNDLCLKRLS
jgi:endonuclease III